MFTDKNPSLIVSYLTLRKLIGILGMLLPFACLLGGCGLQSLPVLDSISSYYHSNMRDVLVGLLVGVAMFLVTYKGHETRDTIIAIASGIAGLGIAIFPCSYPNAPPSGVGVFQLSPDVTGYFHYGFSALFFLLLAVNSFFLFTIGNMKSWTRRKTYRNWIYRFCGIIIFASLLTLAILRIILGAGLGETVWTLVFETVMLEAFGISWLVKGEGLLKDRPDEQHFDLMAS